ncbi:MAG: hypothetical protein Q9174_001150, partial [Haloplaca sp. 1 TL-2023]
MTSHRPDLYPLATRGFSSTPTFRRQHAGGQPPTLLTADFGGARSQHLNIASASQTPLSTTSLSAPFSAHPTSAYPISPQADFGESSAMATRSRAPLRALWTRLQDRGKRVNRLDFLDMLLVSRDPTVFFACVGPYICLLLTLIEPVASPPPPYSPRRSERPSESPRNVQETISPSDTVSSMTDSSYQGTPISAATTMSPDIHSSYLSRRSPPPRPHRMGDSSASSSATPSFPPPPPATQGPASRVRSSSKSHAERLLSTLGAKSKSQNTSPPASAIDTLQATTAQALAQNPEPQADTAVRAPASRRAASTGGIGLSGQSSRAASRSPSQAQWEPGMPLPPPPPGPPPAAARSQSLNRSSESLASDHLSAGSSRSRRPPGTGTALAPVPPTPADWREETTNTAEDCQSGAGPSRFHAQAPLHIDTGSIVHNGVQGNEDASAAVSANPFSARPRRDSSCGALARSPAVRNRSAKGIRERRSESRNGMARAIDSSTEIQSSTITVSPDSMGEVKPTDLVLPMGNGSFSRRRTIHRRTPTSGKNMLSLDETLHSPRMYESPVQSGGLSSSNTTPQPGHGSPPSNSGSRPLLSPTRVSFAPLVRHQSSPALPPKPLPSLSHQLIDTQSSASLDVALASDGRPISHLLHMPNSDESIQEPLLPSAQKKNRKSVADLLGPESPQAFAQRAMDRHRNFAKREAAASNDSERLDLFVQFIVAESRIRREQYAEVFDEEELSASELTQGMFEHLTVTSPKGKSNGRRVEEETTSNRESRKSSLSNSVSESNWNPGSSVASRTHESPISISTDCSSQNRPESSWWNDYIPSLSPIASMSIVTGQDREEVGSRGRASSRWWEDKSGESANGDGFSVLKKSKRESKYMGLPKEARHSPAIFEAAESGPSNRLPVYGESASASHFQSYGPNEYPPEKAGWHHQQQPSPLPPPPAHPPTPMSAPFTPDPRKLDISRFVTLPPPYPRHHPAVNNNHPDLADVRAVVRSLHETEEVDAIKVTYTSQINEKRQRANSWRQHQQSLHDQDMRFRIDHEDLSPGDIDQAEANLSTKIHRSEKEIAQADFDLFQNIVVSPLHSLFAARISKANTSIEELSSRLFSDAQKHSPNVAQEEGDEQPELLEKLTQLKWLFEARESLHRKTYDLLSERNDKYRNIVLLPYTQSSNHTKAADAETFFAADAKDRALEFAAQEAERYDAFLAVIEANVTRGVEIQLSAFWDIAPPLHRVLTRVPHDLSSGFEIQIPAA